MHRLNTDVIDNVWALAGVRAVCTLAACSVKIAGIIQNARVQSAGAARTRCHWGSCSCCFFSPAFRARCDSAAARQRDAGKS